VAKISRRRPAEGGIVSRRKREGRSLIAVTRGDKRDSMDSDLVRLWGRQGGQGSIELRNKEA